MVIFKAIESSALKCNDMVQFIQTFENFITNFKDMAYFKEELKYTFLNKHLLYECRLKTIKSKQENYFNSPQYRPINSEKCHEKSVYCFWLRFQRFINDSNFILRSQNLAETLKYNHFNPYHFRSDSLTSNPILLSLLDLDKNHQLQPSIRQIEPLDALEMEIRKKTSSQSGLYFEDELTSSNVSKVREPNSVGSFDEFAEKDDKGELENDGDDLMHESDDNPLKIPSKRRTKLNEVAFEEPVNSPQQIADGKENQQTDNAPVRNLDNKNIGETIPEPESEKEQKKQEDALLMIRGDHICALQNLAFDRKKHFQIQRNLFFDKAARLLNKHLGNIVVGFQSQIKERTMKKMRSVNPKPLASERVITRQRLDRQHHLSLEPINRETRFKSNEVRTRPRPSQRAPLILHKFEDQHPKNQHSRPSFWLQQFLKAKNFEFGLQVDHKQASSPLN
jgi:hypothetical protein